MVLFYFILLKIKHPRMWHQSMRKGQENVPFTFIALFITFKLGLLSLELGLFSSSSVSAASPASSTTPVTSCNYRTRRETSAKVLKSEIIWVQIPACVFIVSCELPLFPLRLLIDSCWSSMIFFSISISASPSSISHWTTWSLTFGSSPPWASRTFCRASWAFEWNRMVPWEGCQKWMEEDIFKV